MESNLHRYRSQLETTPWFRGLPVELRDYLISHAKLLALEKGQFLYRRGEQSYGLYAVLGGALAMGTVGVDGREALLAVLGPTSMGGRNLTVRWAATSAQRHRTWQDAFAARSRVRAAKPARLHTPLLARLCVIDGATTSGFARERRSNDSVARSAARGEPFVDDRRRLWRPQRRTKQDKALARQPRFNGVPVATDHESVAEEPRKSTHLEPEIRGNRHSGFRPIASRQSRRLSSVIVLHVRHVVGERAAERAL